MFLILTETTTKSILAKIKIKVKSYYFYVVLSLLFTGLFFGFEYLPKHSKEYYSAKKELKKAVKKNNFWLKKVKDNDKGSEDHNNYLKANKEKVIIVGNYNEIKESEKVKRFNTIRIFLKEFGGYLGFFLYALFNLHYSLTKRKQNAINLFHSYILCICIFFMYWSIQPFEDITKFSYYFISFVSAAAVVYAVYLFTKYRKTKIQKLEMQKAQLQTQKKEIAKFAYLNIPDDKNDEMIDLLDKHL